jgi:DNA-directed RNA polymerase subunit RPC12/RpoP
MASTTTGDSKVLIKCSTCGVEFTSNTAAGQHMKGHPGHELPTPAQPLIKCSTCGVEFTSPELWKEHLKEHHNNKTI